jgi:hypothetical protein
MHIFFTSRFTSYNKQSLYMRVTIPWTYHRVYTVFWGGVVTVSGNLWEENVPGTIQVNGVFGR